MEEYDILIVNGYVVDGTGRPMFKANVAIKAPFIEAVGPEVKGDAKLVIDAKGLIVCPGFIDVHSHADKTLPIFPTADGYVMQGVTTTIGGNCGNTIAPIRKYWPPNMFWDLDLLNEVRPYKYGLDELIPFEEMRKKVKEVYGVDINWHTFAEFLDWLERNRISVNHVPLVGHNTIRAQVMGLEKREPKPEELKEMKELIREAMEAGALGMSSGLDYVPGCYAKTEELVELVKVVKEYGGFYFTHWRSIRRDEVTIRDKLAGIKEALEIGRRAGVKVELSHLTSGFTIFPRPSPELERASAEATLEVIDEAIKGGVDVYFDIIPNTTGGTLTFRYLASILAPWLRELGSREALSRALRMKDFRDEIKKAILEGKVLFLHPSVNPYWSEELEVVGHKEDKYKGKTIAEIAREEGKDPIDALFDILASDPNTIIYEKVERGEEEIKTFLRHERCMIGLDTYSFSLYWEMKGPPHYLPHPNTYGAVPRLIRKYVREEKVLSLEEAIRRLTSMPARRFMIDRRGVIEPGAYADIVIFDYNTISEVIDKEEPRRPPKGIHYVIVNGVLVVEKGRHTGAKPGKVIRFRRARGERP